MSQQKSDLNLKRLKSKYAIEHLFSEGEVLGTKHLIFRVTKEKEGPSFFAGVSVSKRNFKKAVDRNRIKRQLRIALKANQHFLSFPGNGMLLFKGRKQLTTQTIIAETQRLLEKL